MIKGYRPNRIFQYVATSGNVSQEIMMPISIIVVKLISQLLGKIHSVMSIMTHENEAVLGSRE